MLFAAIEVAAGGNGFTGRQMHAADTASNHVFAVLRWAVLRRAGLRCGGVRWSRRARLPRMIAQEQVQHDEDGDDEEELCHANLAAQMSWIGRGERIRTSDSCVPNAVLYQAELHPDGEFQYLRVTAKVANSSKLSLYFESGSFAIASRASRAEASARVRVYSSAPVSRIAFTTGSKLLRPPSMSALRMIAPCFALPWPMASIIGSVVLPCARSSPRFFPVC